MDQQYFMEKLKELLAIDSTTGQYEEIENYVAAEMAALGFESVHTHKGGLLTDLGGEGNDLAVTAHLDDIGLMVRKINPDGTLNVCPVGGLYPFYCVTENVRVHTRKNGVVTGQVARIPNSIHVSEEELRDAMPDFRKNVCVILDANVKSAEDTRALGVETGDLIALEPRFTESGGYLKSRFIDDKANVAILMTAAKALSEAKKEGKVPNRKIIAYWGVYEEIGHGTSYLPEGVKDVLAIDIAPVGPDQNSDEHKVSLFAKDSRYPYHLGFLRELQETAEEAGVDFVTDVFTPHYGSDGDTSIVAGHDIRHACIGPGTLNSHGYERTHMDGVENTYRLLMAYLER